MTDRREAEPRILSSSEAYRSNLVVRLRLASTSSLRAQIGLEVMDTEDRAAEVAAQTSTQRLEQLRDEYAMNALQATLGANDPQSPEVEANQAEQNAPVFRGHMPGFSAEVAPPIDIDVSQN